MTSLAPVRGYYLSPDLTSCHVLVAYFNTSKSGHYGLGINGLHTIRVLRKNRIRADLVPVASVADLEAALVRYGDITHCLIEAPWISTPNMADLCMRFGDTHFIMRVHSQVAFLQVEAGAVKLIREQLHLQESQLNFSVSANSNRLTRFLRTAYSADCLYLPNLYDIDRPVRQPPQSHDHRLLRIGSFGAIRLLKNHISAAAAALLIAKSRRADLEFYLNVNRQEHGKGVVDAIKNLFTGLTYARIVEVPWQDWPNFRRIVAGMDLTLQPSMSETFNIVTADAVCEGIPSAVSNCIEWVPSYWHVDVDDVDNIARVGGQLLSDGNAAANGLLALETFQDNAIRVWTTYLASQPSAPNFV